MPAILDWSGAAGGEAACFLRGTRILMRGGECPVEDIAPGMTALTPDGRQRIVLDVIERRLDLSRHPRPSAAQPIRVRRGALGNNVPARDLLVSPDHALLVASALIPARALVNGATLLRETQWPVVSYVSVALDAHDLLLAEGAPVESLPDAARRTASRGRLVSLFPRFADTPPAPSDCAPRALSGQVVLDARHLLLARARMLGHAVTREADLHLLVDAARIRPSGVAGHLHRFSVPSGARDLRIVCRAGVPAELDPNSDDRRRLGVMLSRIVLRAYGQQIELPLADPCLREGFYPVERVGTTTWRWTDGHARLAEVPAGLSQVDLYVLGVQAAWARALPPSAPAKLEA